MFKIKNTPLQEIYEKLADIPFDKKDGRSDTVCYICVTRLNSFCKLRYLATQTDKILTKLLDNKLVIEENTLNLFRIDVAYKYLSIEVLDAIDITDNETNVKCEQQDDIKLELPKHEEEPHTGAPRAGDEMRHGNSQMDGVPYVANLSDTPQHSDVDNDEPADSDDDLPLKTISVMNSVDRERQKTSKRKHKTESILNSVEVILTHQQQMCELAERSKTLNYLNSPYKCDLCYKGFVHAQAFDNHKEKHSESSGPLQCPVCRLRYSSARQLRAHVSAAHERRYVCNRCQHRSHTKNQALVHERWHDGHTYPCKLCGETFSRPTTYLTHARKAHASEHVCVQCGHSFVGRHGLLMHASKAHRGTGQTTEPPGEPPDKRLCKDCNIQFSSLEALTRHVLTSVKHTAWDDDSLECRICEARVQPELRREHMRTHARAMRPKSDAPRSEPLAMISCDQCPATFASRARLAAHVRCVHLGVKYDRNVICELCGKKCTSHARLRYHQRRHTGLRPHVCTACGARFADTNQLRIHARKHSGERPYACAACGKRFSQKPALNRHYRVHTGAKPYECQLCSKSFSQSNSVKLHVNTVHLKLTSHRKRIKDPPQPES